MAAPFDPSRPPSRQSVRAARAVRRTFRPAARLLPSDRLAVSVVRGLLRSPTLRTRIPADLAVEEVAEPFEDGVVEGEWLRPAGTSERDGTVLYIHGSGYVCSSPKTHRVITVALARLARLPVFAVRYRLAPSHRFPAAADDVRAAYRWLLEQGIRAERIALAGDSAGGHLAIGLAVEGCRDGLPAPAGMYLLSPLVDASWELARARDRERPDPTVSAARAKRITDLYFSGADQSDARIGLLSCDAAALPPSLVQAGGLEMLSADAEAFADYVRGAGGDCELQVWPGQLHVFQALHRIVPEGRHALELGADFLRGVVGAAQEPELAEAG